MTYIYGREVRADDLSRRQVFVAVMGISFGLRGVFSKVLGAKYTFSFLGFLLDDWTEAIILHMIFTAVIAFAYLYLLNNERDFHETLILSFISPALSIVFYSFDHYKLDKYRDLFLMAIAICFLGGCAKYYKRYIRAKKKQKRLRRLKAAKVSFRVSYNWMKMVVLYSFSVLIVPTIMHGRANSKSMVFSTAKPEVYERSEMDDLLDQHMDVLAGLKSDTYASLTEEERLYKYQILLNCYLSYLDCDEGCRLVAQELPSTTYGYYNDVDKIVAVNEEVLMSEKNCSQMVETIGHESFHVYQHECIRRLDDYDAEDPMLYQIRLWESEAENYTDYDPNIENGRGTYDSYRNQFLESSAFSFGYMWEEHITQYIENYERGR